MNGSKRSGRVWLVGAGPGDPDLLTVRALRVLQSADVVLHDRLVGEQVLDCIPDCAERINVGKSCGDHPWPQARINVALIGRARAGQQVVRLKGGDPFIFGRGGEEMDAVRAAGLECEVVPGITAAIGCAAAAGVPLTDRRYTAGCSFVTAHGAAGRDAPDWQALARSGHTLAIYMGLGQLAEIRDGLLAGGCRPGLPVVLISAGTTAQECRVTGTLGELAQLAQVPGVVSPALLVVGEPAALAQPLPHTAPGTAPAGAAAKEAPAFAMAAPLTALRSRMRRHRAA